MSNFYGPGSELLYSFFGAATTSVPTAAAVTITAGYPPIIVPANYMGQVGARSSSLLLKFGGLATVTAAIPTWQFNLYGNIATTSAPAFAASGVTLGSTAAFTPGQAAANFWWDAVIEIGLRTLALGATSTVSAIGKIKSAAFLPAAYSATSTLEIPFPANGTYTPAANWDTTQGYVLWPALTLGAATAGNTVTVEYCKLYGEN